MVNKGNVRGITACGLMVAVQIILSQIAVPLPFSPIPVSLGVLAVFFCGAVLKPGAAFFAQIAYLLLGAVGVPVFAGFKGGLGALFGPTGGFLFAYPLMALIVSYSANVAGNRHSVKKTGLLVAGMFVSLIPLYGLGAGWYAISQQVSFQTALNLCVIPFVVPELMKIGVSATLLPVLQSRVRPFVSVPARSA